MLTLGREGTDINPKKSAVVYRGPMRRQILTHDANVQVSSFPHRTRSAVIEPIRHKSCFLEWERTVS
jgi:hypothetical protein